MPFAIREEDAVRAARAVVREPAAIVDRIRTTPLEYDAYLPGRFLSRVAGTATVDTVIKPWSAVVKWTDPPSVTQNSPYERAWREASAYQSGMLNSVAGLRAPRAYDVSAPPHGPIVLWLEDVGAVTGPWSLSEFGRAARAIGHFNGALVGRDLGSHDWLVRDWADRQSEPVDFEAELALIRMATAQSQVRDALGEDAAARATRMLLCQPAYKQALGELPQTLCHHDMAQSNLFIPANDGERVVAIDWELTGTGPLGADIAPLISGSLRKGAFPSDKTAELDSAIFDAYVRGLRDAGWAGSAESIRVGVSASLALRYWFIRDTLRTLSDGGGATAPHIVPISLYLLDRSDEAMGLITR